MTKVKCDAFGCLDNKDGTCQSEEIEISFVMASKKPKICSKRRYAKKPDTHFGHY